MTDFWDWVFRAFPILMSLATLVYAFFATRRKDVDERMKAGGERMDRHEGRIARLEQTVAGMPSKDDLHKIELHMERIGGTMSRMEAVMEGNQKIMGRLELIVTRHEDHLLSGAKT